MSNPMGDRNLLAGILAWQRKFIGSDVLVAAMNAWTLAKEKGLAQILREQKALTENQHALLEQAVHDHLARHGNDVPKTLAALRAVDSVRQKLGHVADPDLQASLAHVSSASAPAAEEAILVAELAEVAAAPKKTPAPPKPVKAAAKKNAAARGSSALVWLAGCALGGGCALMISTLVLVLAFLLLRDHPRFAQAKPDGPVNHGNPVDKGDNKPLPIEDPKIPDPLQVEPKPIDLKPIEPKPASPAPADGFVSLFNGKDLTGWKPHKTRGGAWRVENGILIGSPSNNGAYFLQTEQPQPRDFHLRVEARIGAPGNGSVYVRFQPDGPIVGYEAMIRAANNLPGQVAVGGLALSYPGKGRAFPGGNRTQVPAGQWFTLEVIAKGDRLIAKADGQTTMDLIDPTILTAGHVALGQVAQSPIEFRKIEIKDLNKVIVARPDAAAPFPMEAGFVSLFNGKDLTGWKERFPSWRVDKGVLIGSATPNRNAVLHSEAKFQDFHLRAEVRCGEKNIGKIGIRSADGFVYGYNASMVSVPAGDVRVGLIDATTVKKGFTLQRLLPAQTIPPGQWFNLEVIAQGNRLIAQVNGKKTTDAVDASIPDAGYISLTLLGAESIEFRKIEIKELNAEAPPERVVVVAAPKDPPPIVPPPKGAPPFALDKDFVPLFNGKDLTGWKQGDKRQRDWKVLDGILTGAGPDLNSLYTPRDDYGDFHLRAEVRINDAGDSHILFRSPYGPAEIDTINSGGYLVRLNANPQVITKAGSLMVIEKVGVRNLFVKEPMVRPGQWYNLEIIARGNQVTTKLNGQEAINFSNPKTDLMGGRLILTAANLFKGNTLVEFRKIEIKEFKAVPPPPRDPIVVAKFVPLFNGKDLTGWKSAGQPPRGWKVVDGILTGNGPNLDALYTPRDNYGDFHLRMEARINDDGNSFVGFRCPLGAAELDAAVLGGYAIRLNGRPDDQSKTGSLLVFDKGATRHHFFARESPAAGPWFSIEVIAKGDRVETKINGRNMIFGNPKKDLKSGRIVLGLTDVKNRQTLVEFRKIEISEPNEVIAAPPEKRAEVFMPLFNGKDLTGWKVHQQHPGEWRVVNGSLIGKAPAKWQTILHTERADFKDFHLRVEARGSLKSSGRVGVRSSDGGRHGYVANIDGVFPGTILRVGGVAAYTDDNRAFTLPRLADVNLPAGQWFMLEVIADGKRLTVLVDGKKVTDVNNATMLAGGHLTLGISGPDTLEVRKVEIAEFKPAAAPRRPLVPVGEFAPLFNGKDLAGWQAHAPLEFACKRCRGRVHSHIPPQSAGEEKLAQGCASGW